MEEENMSAQLLDGKLMSDELRARIAERVAALKAKAAIDEIVMIEGLKAEEEDIAKAMAVVCRHNGITMEELKEQYDSALEQLITNSVLTGKVMRLIRDAAVVTEV